jgi:hypothetical protein
MKTTKKSISDLSRFLFWDTDYTTIDPEKHAEYIIDRVLSRGSLEDFRILVAYYGKPKIKKIAKQIRYLDDRTLHFCSAYFSVPLNDFRCFILKQSNQAAWNY